MGSWPGRVIYRLFRLPRWLPFCPPPEPTRFPLSTLQVFQVWYFTLYIRWSVVAIRSTRRVSLGSTLFSCIVLASVPCIGLLGIPLISRCRYMMSSAPGVGLIPPASGAVLMSWLGVISTRPCAVAAAGLMTDCMIVMTTLADTKIGTNCWRRALIFNGQRRDVHCSVVVPIAHWAVIVPEVACGRGDRVRHAQFGD